MSRDNRNNKENFPLINPAMIQNSITDARENQIQCHHRVNSDPILTAYSQYIQRQKNSGDEQDVVDLLARKARPNIKINEFTFVCDKCKDLGNLQALTKDELDQTFTNLYSMIFQLKILVDMSEQSAENIESIQRWVDMTYQFLVPYYLTSMKHLTGNNGKNNGKNKNGHGKPKGSFGAGINSGNFNRR